MSPCQQQHDATIFSEFQYQNSAPLAKTAHFFANGIRSFFPFLNQIALLALNFTFARALSLNLHLFLSLL